MNAFREDGPPPIRCVAFGCRDVATFRDPRVVVAVGKDRRPNIFCDKHRQEAWSTVSLKYVYVPDKIGCLGGGTRVEMEENQPKQIDFYDQAAPKNTGPYDYSAFSMESIDREATRIFEEFKKKAKFLGITPKEQNEIIRSVMQKVIDTNGFLL